MIERGASRGSVIARDARIALRIACSVDQRRSFSGWRTGRFRPPAGILRRCAMRSAKTRI